MKWTNNERVDIKFDIVFRYYNDLIGYSTWDEINEKLFDKVRDVIFPIKEEILNEMDK